MWIIDLIMGKRFKQLAKKLEGDSVKRLENAVVKSEAAMVAAREVSKELRAAKREEKVAQDDLEVVMRELQRRINTGE